ncbi:AMP-binding protein [Alkalihalobacterium chitinilyticum]|uniref:acetate--CoA ligase n=1 Tax=Alkalihalobacterium chitinilyticum TaxID=2980103 RepID=A0ABT5VJN9_9BACI|nr:AMP-binding protein [Alkalihalobacterium chitinilyticum]MDE5414942.1 AMP-binding protein [Alkalihalobacterium chitinilyticum]
MTVAWKPSDEMIEKTRLYQWMRQLGYTDYEEFLNASTKDIAWFWKEAEKVLNIDWYEPYKETLSLEDGVKWPKWFVGGKLNTAYNTVETWADKKETANAKAIVWESEDGIVQTYTYEQLAEAVARVANGFRQQGLKKGDIIAIYMPMVPETVIAMMAAAKIGAIYSPIFSGYGTDAVATRLNAAKAKMIVTADGFLRRGRPVAMKEEADRAVEKSPSIEKVIVFRRLDRDIPWNDSRDVDWKQLMKEEPLKETLSMDSADPLMLIYTSGTTGRPKGAVHTHSGFPIKAAFDAGIGMDVKKGDTLFWYTDMGWMMGPFLVFGGLMNGATILLYEGTPDFPQPDRLWEVVDKHQVTHLGISPTLIRSMMKHGEEWPQKHNLSTLRVIASTGEPWNPEPWLWLFEKVGQSRIPIFNYSGGTEISGGILGNVLVRPIGPITFNSPLPGMDVDVLDEDGKPVLNSVGELVIKQPWVGMTKGFWNEPQRYEEAYWSRWENIWVHGDWVIKDSDGFWTITGRSDDILNVAGKRLGPAEIESILVEHPNVVEAGTIGIPDDIKGEVAVCFAVLNQNGLQLEQLREELLQLVAVKMGKALKPKAIYFVQDLPKTRNAKVMRRAIKAAYLNKDAGDLSSLENPQALTEINQLGKNA